MIKNKLKINDSKTKFLVLSSSFFKKQFNDLQINVGNTEINPSLSARNLGVIFDSHLNLGSHINSVCRSEYFHLRNIRSIRNMLSGVVGRERMGTTFPHKKLSGNGVPTRESFRNNLLLLLN